MNAGSLGYCFYFVKSPVHVAGWYAYMHLFTVACLLKQELPNPEAYAMQHDNASCNVLRHSILRKCNVSHLDCFAGHHTFCLCCCGIFLFCMCYFSWSYHFFSGNYCSNFISTKFLEIISKVIVTLLDYPLIAWAILRYSVSLKTYVIHVSSVCKWASYLLLKVFLLFPYFELVWGSHSSQPLWIYSSFAKCSMKCVWFFFC